jgi:hypothetical protein
MSAQVGAFFMILQPESSVLTFYNIRVASGII